MHLSILAEFIDNFNLIILSYSNIKKVTYVYVFTQTLYMGVIQGKILNDFHVVSHTPSARFNFSLISLFL